jgi:hypothetical protein
MMHGDVSHSCEIELLSLTTAVGLVLVYRSLFLCLCCYFSFSVSLVSFSLMFTFCVYGFI